ncbi:MAG: polyprenyl synthetase family protein [Chloroflexi bacterium]|nr:polyprenyl synthetase family protein [Chloroflexota bacterium]
MADESTLNPESVYRELREFLDTIMTAFAADGVERICVYLEDRNQSKAAIKQDLLPLLVYEAINQTDYAPAIPLAASWTMYLAASHMLDDAQDAQNMAQINDAIMSLGIATVALSKLAIDHDTLTDLLDALGHVMVFGATAQSVELQQAKTWSRQQYFRNIAGKAAAIIATGIWIGGRLSTDDAQTLTVLKEFGFALGMSIQISDDCLDLAEDLTCGISTLPVLEGLAMKDHPNYPILKQLVEQDVLSAEQVQYFVTMLEEMGVLQQCQQVVRAYQVQAAAVFDILPNMEPYFLEYVASKNEYHPL